jgi:hypothetical protein
MTITSATTDDTYYKFEFDNGATCSVGKQTETNPDGVASYEEAIENLLLNFPDLII